MLANPRKKEDGSGEKNTTVFPRNTCINRDSYTGNAQGFPWRAAPAAGIGRHG